MDEENNNLVEESRGLTFKDILFIIRKHWIAIVAFLVTCTAGGFIWSKVETPTYQSTGTIMVSYESGNATAVNTEYSFANNLTNTVVGFIKTQTVLDKVSTQVNVPSDKLAANLSAKNSTGNLLITVSYTSSNKEEAKKVLDAIMQTTIDVANERTAEDKPVYHMLSDNLNIVDKASDAKRVSHTLRNTAIGGGAGVVLAFLFVLIWELSDNTFKSTEEIERVLNIPVLAGIPDYHFNDEKKGGK